jgi:hypothetical protein
MSAVPAPVSEATTSASPFTASASSITSSASPITASSAALSTQAMSISRTLRLVHGYMTSPVTRAESTYYHTDSISLYVAIWISFQTLRGSTPPRTRWTRRRVRVNARPRASSCGAARTASMCMMRSSLEIIVRSTASLVVRVACPADQREPKERAFTIDYKGKARYLYSEIYQFLGRGERASSGIETNKDRQATCSGERQTRCHGEASASSARFRLGEESRTQSRARGCLGPRAYTRVRSAILVEREAILAAEVFERDRAFLLGKHLFDASGDAGGGVESDVPTRQGRSCRRCTCA